MQLSAVSIIVKLLAQAFAQARVSVWLTPGWPRPGF